MYLMKSSLYRQQHKSKHRVGQMQSDTQLEDFRQEILDMVFVILMAKEFLLWSILNQNPLFQLELQSEVYYLLWLVVQGWVVLCPFSFSTLRKFFDIKGL